jgi:hypothetical protein
MVLFSCVVTQEPADPTLPELSFVLPQPPAETMGGQAFAHSVETLDLAAREAAVYTEFMRGNFPAFLRHPVSLSISDTLQGRPYELTLAVLPDYLCLGTDEDYLLMPMTPILAQRIMDSIGGILPTSRLVDIIWDNALLKLEPQPIPPSPDMVTLQVFEEHSRIVQSIRDSLMQAYPQGVLTAGHKKDVILANLLETHPGKVIIYGWHYPDGRVIQPVYAGHANWYADYSHGIRALAAECIVNDSLWQVADLLQDPVLYRLLSDEAGPMETTRYDTASVNYP